MRSSTIPGFKEIFPSENQSYASLVSELSSDTIIKLCSALNSELTCPEPRWEIHARLNFILIRRFSDEQRNYILHAFGLFKEKAGDGFQAMMFHRRYLVAMILKELNCYRTVNDIADHPDHDYRFFKAYLKVVDEVNGADHSDIDFKSLDKSDPLWPMRLCWLPVIRQFELNEKGNIIFEMLKSACFLQYAAQNFRAPLKDYLRSFGFSSPGQLIGSYNSIYKTTEMYDPKQMLRKYTLINVEVNTNVQHLKDQTISPEIKGKLRFSDLKKHPVFFSPQRDKYIVMDSYLAQRKVLRGPYFELFHKTSLKPVDEKLQNDAYVQYSQKIAEVLEKHCLKPILTLLAKQDCDVVHFDDGTDSVPDGYLRVGRKIFLFEYKAYFFPERLAEQPNFEKLKAYFDRGFIANEAGKEKGVNQLKKQILIINEKGFAFDPEAKKLLDSGGLTIYPIITYNDFYFGISGLNVYLHNVFFDSIPKELEDKFSIVPLVMTNLESLLDMVLTGQGVTQLEHHIHRFFGFAQTAQQSLQVTKSQTDFLKTNIGFDEVYNWQFAPKPGDIDSTQNVLSQLLELAGVSFDELERPLD